ncbi:MAG: DUF2778 domain-containing protein [Pseudomonadales bacterium]|nr:DUF2778 domain-containing protein [Pseudomonadales bacterium]
MGRNNPAYNGTRNLGPTPRGTWDIGASEDRADTGPNSIRITHADGDRFPVGRDRGTFLIHGNNQQNDASQGCLILGPTERRAIINGGGGTLTVTE